VGNPPTNQSHQRTNRYCSKKLAPIYTPCTAGLAKLPTLQHGRWKSPASTISHIKQVFCAISSINYPPNGARFHDGAKHGSPDMNIIICDLNGMILFFFRLSDCSGPTPTDQETEVPVRLRGSGLTHTATEARPTALDAIQANANPLLTLTIQESESPARGRTVDGGWRHRQVM
jgi:hypothetical protein